MVVILNWSLSVVEGTWLLVIRYLVIGYWLLVD